MDNNVKNTSTTNSKSTKESEDRARSIFERWANDEEDVVAHILGDDEEAAHK